MYIAQGSGRHLECCDSDGDSLSKGADGEAEGKSLLDCAVTRTDKRADPTQVVSHLLISSHLLSVLQADPFNKVHSVIF